MGGRIAADSTSLAPRHTREMIFVGLRQAEPLAAVLAFRSVEGERDRARESRGWLAHGNRWESFLDERWTSGRVGSAWNVVPHGALRVAAGSGGEIEAIWFRRSGRSLRLDLHEPLTGWTRGPSSRLNLLAGSLNVGGELAPGVVVELLALRRPRDDPPEETGQVLLTSGDSLTLFVDTGGGAGGTPSGTAWMRNRAGVVREWNEVRLTARGGRPLPEARREIPEGWGLLVPEAGIRGEIRPLGYAAEIGLERAGRRAVEARYTVTGWIEVDGRRRGVVGVVRYAVD